VAEKFGFVRLVALLILIMLEGALTGCDRLKKETWEKAPLRKGQVEVRWLGEHANLTVEGVRFFSKEMNEPRFFLALVPRTEKPQEEVLILNHGWFDRPESLLTDLKVDQVYDALLAQGKVRPAVIVMPDVRFGDYYRLREFPFPTHLAFVAEEVMRVASQKYSIPISRERWSIGGFSFGGYVALDVARRYAGRFSSVSVVSAFYDDQWSFWPSVPPAPGRLDSKGRGKHTIVEAGPVPQMLLACGTEDRYFGSMFALHEQFSRRGIAHAWLTAPGGHTWEFWAAVLTPMLEFHLAADARSRKGRR
jgi:enterochelin esterase-like enzyme